MRKGLPIKTKIKMARLNKMKTILMRMRTVFMKMILTKKNKWKSKFKKSTVKNFQNRLVLVVGKLMRLQTRKVSYVS